MIKRLLKSTTTSVVLGIPKKFVRKTHKFMRRSSLVSLECDEAFRTIGFPYHNVHTQRIVQAKK